MRCISKFAVVFCVWGAAVSAAAQTEPAPVSFAPGRSAAEIVDFMLEVGTQVHWTEMDCSHFVHYLYEMAGLHYSYADSTTLYRGEADGFRRVSKPQPGDVIAWEGHVGIVVDSEQRIFLSVLRTGVKSDDYDSHYWKLRGHPRFFRYTSLPKAHNLNRELELLSIHTDLEPADNEDDE